MGNSNSLINLGDWSKPANTLIEKISNAIGGLCKPGQIRRVAQAEAEATIIHARAGAEADMIAAAARIEVTELQRRAMCRFIAEETKKQNNIETIIRKALPQLDPQGRPDQVEDDWIANFFERCRLISDEEMQSLWAKLLAGEANSPGRFSKRTVNLVASLDKADAMLFSKFCGFVFMIGDPYRDPYPLIYDTEADIYTSNGVNFGALSHLESIGLIQLNPIGGYLRKGVGHSGFVHYFGRPVWIELPKPSDNDLNIGKSLLSQAGSQLLPICGGQPVEGFVEYVRQRWRAFGYKTEAEGEPDPAKSAATAKA